MPDSAPLDELMSRLAEGDRSAFPQVFHQLWEPILRLCTRMTGVDADGADAAQAAMLRIFERSSEYDRKRPALPWALGIASWECRTTLKKRSRLRETPDAMPETDEGAAAFEQDRRLMLAAALNAMGTLSELDQQTIVATYWELASTAAGATLRKRRARALTRLRDAFRRLYGLD